MAPLPDAPASAESLRKMSVPPGKVSLEASPEGPMSAYIRSVGSLATSSDSKADDDAEQAERKLGEILQALTSESWQRLELHEVERRVFVHVLELGLLLLRAFLAKRGSGRPARLVSDGRTIPYHSQKTTTYFSIFGKLVISRAYFWSESSGGGVCPLDAELNLPARQYSYFLQEFATLFATRDAYEKVTDVLERVFGVKLWKQGTEILVRETGAEVQAFYEQKGPVPPKSEGAILVNGADGKGVPIRRPEKVRKTIRRTSGIKRNKKKVSIVSAVYTIDPRPRTPADVVASLFNDEPTDRRVDPASPKNKRLRAKFGLAAEAFEEMRRHNEERSPRDHSTRVLLMDGEKRMIEKAALPQYDDWTKILDFLHVAQYIWDAGVALHGEGKADGWVRTNMLRVLSGESAAVADDVETAMLNRGRPSKVLTRVCRYLRANEARMRYDEYLAAGLPIATGVVEGACCTLVKDRTGRSAMRWSAEGAQAVLELRAVDQNGDWTAFWAWFTKSEHRRLYPHRLKKVAA